MKIAVEDFKLLLSIIDDLCDEAMITYKDKAGTKRCRFCIGEETGSYDHHSFIHRPHCIITRNTDLQARFRDLGED